MTRMRKAAELSDNQANEPQHVWDLYSVEERVQRLVWRLEDLEDGVRNQDAMIAVMRPKVKAMLERALKDGLLDAGQELAEDMVADCVDDLDLDGEVGPGEEDEMVALLMWAVQDCVARLIRVGIIDGLYRLLYDELDVQVSEGLREEVVDAVYAAAARAADDEAD